MTPEERVALILKCFGPRFCPPGGKHDYECYAGDADLSRRALEQVTAAEAQGRRAGLEEAAQEAETQRPEFATRYQIAAGIRALAQPPAEEGDAK